MLRLRGILGATYVAQIFDLKPTPSSLGTPLARRCECDCIRTNAATGSRAIPFVISTQLHCFIISSFHRFSFQPWHTDFADSLQCCITNPFIVFELPPVYIHLFTQGIHRNPVTVQSHLQGSCSSFCTVGPPRYGSTNTNDSNYGLHHVGEPRQFVVYP